MKDAGSTFFQKLVVKLFNILSACMTAWFVFIIAVKLANFCLFISLPCFMTERDVKASGSGITVAC